MKYSFRLLTLVFFFCTLLSCDKSNYKDASYDPISIDGFYTHKVMPDGSFIIVSNEEQLQDILAEEVSYYLGKVDFSKRNMLLIYGESNYGIYEVVKNLDIVEDKYCFNITVMQNYYCVVLPWCIAYDVPKSIKGEDVVVEISYENPIN